MTKYITLRNKWRDKKKLKLPNGPLPLTLDRCLEALGNCHHDISPKHPEDVVDKEAAQEQATHFDAVQGDHLYSVHRKGQAKEIVKDPLLQEN